MKVCTDACLFGAWFARKNLHAKSILDIGSGTGLLMLMLAQNHSSDFHGIEIDNFCFQQLKENIGNSKWSDRIELTEGDVRHFSSEWKFDFIVSNPPFYENSLTSPSAGANLARHSSHLTLEELLASINRNLSPSGSFAILLPYHRSEEFESIVKKNDFYVVEKVAVRQSPRHNFFRCIYHCTRTQPEKISENEIVIHHDSGEYTDEFVGLLKDYYLHLRPD